MYAIVHWHQIRLPVFCVDENMIIGKFDKGIFLHFILITITTTNLPTFRQTTPRRLKIHTYVHIHILVCMECMFATPSCHM